MHYFAQEEALVFLLLARKETTDTWHFDASKFVWKPEASRSG